MKRRHRVRHALWNFLLDVLAAAAKAWDDALP